MCFSFPRSNHGLSPGQVSVVGVHARRTDYKHWLASRAEGKAVNAEYFIRGMDLFRERLHGQAVAFVFASDDLKWCTRSFEDLDGVFFSKFKSAHEDMALLRSADHFLGR